MPHAGAERYRHGVEILGRGDGIDPLEKTPRCGAEMGRRGEIIMGKGLA